MRKIRSKWWGLGRSDFETFSWRTVVKVLILVVLVSAAVSFYLYTEDQKAEEAKRKAEQAQFEKEYQEKFKTPIYTITPQVKKVEE